MEIKIKFKLFFLALLVANIFLSSPFVVQAQVTANDQYKGAQSDIERFLCSPTAPPTNQSGGYTQASGQQAAGTNTASYDLYNCINRLYKFAIVIASSVGVLMIVVAGYLYMSAEGNKEAVDKAKGIVVSTITAIVLLFIGYVLLRAINPDLIQFQQIQPPSVKLQEAPPPQLKDPFTGGNVTTPQNNQNARALLQANGILIKDTTVNLNGVQPGILSEIVQLKKSCGSSCEVMVTSAADSVHATGQCSHENGYKIDLRPNTTLDNYIMNNFAKQADRSDGAKMYRNNSTGGLYARESNHWDIAQCNNPSS